MRVISLHQPFATLMMLNLKTNETRNRLTHVRGELGIAACASIPKYCKVLLDQPFFAEALKDVDLPTGCILGTVEVVGSMETQAWIDSMLQKKLKVDSEEYFRFMQEIAFGNYDPGRYAWQTINPTPYAEPIPAKGSQGFWFYPKFNAKTGQIHLF